jgi:hypothetical protein
MVTDDQMVAWGIVTEKTDKVVGTKIIIRPGMHWGQAVHAAWCAGHVRICSPEPAVRANRRMSDAARAESIAWVAAHRRAA